MGHLFGRQPEGISEDFNKGVGCNRTSVTMMIIRAIEPQA